MKKRYAYDADELYPVFFNFVDLDDGQNPQLAHCSGVMLEEELVERYERAYAELNEVGWLIQQAENE